TPKGDTAAAWGCSRPRWRPGSRAPSCAAPLPTARTCSSSGPRSPESAGESRLHDRDLFRLAKQDFARFAGATPAGAPVRAQADVVGVGQRAGAGRVLA